MRTSTIQLIRSSLPKFSPEIIFDVGANIGQTTDVFSKQFPKARIFAFEPAPATFVTLCERLKSVPLAEGHQIAFGRRDGTVHITNRPNYVSNSIVTRRSTETADVPLMRGDAFCDKQNIRTIGLLKIDTEGSDLDALVGFTRRLAGQRIDVIDVEVSMNSKNLKHVDFQAVRSFLSAFNYLVFYIHELTLDTTHSGLPFLRRANALFISEVAAKKNSHK